MGEISSGRFYPTGGPFSRRDFRRWKAHVAVCEIPIARTPQSTTRKSASIAVGFRITVVSMFSTGSPAGTPPGIFVGIVTVTGNSIAAANKMASTVVQTSIVASENCSFMAAIVAEGLG